MSEDLKMENPVVQQSLMDSSTEIREPSEQAALRVAEQEDSRKLSEIEA